MATYQIEFEPILAACRQLEQLEAEYKRLVSSYTSLSNAVSFRMGGSQSVQNSLGRIGANLSALQRSFQTLCASLQQIVSFYRRTEHLLSGSTIPGVTASGILFSPKEPDASIPAAPPFSFAGPSALTDSSVTGHTSEDRFLAGASASADASALSFSATDSHEHLSTSMEGKLFGVSAQVSGRAENATDTSEYGAHTYLGGKAQAEAVAAKVHGSSSLGTQNWGLESSGTAALGGVSATASSALEINRNRSATVSGKLEAEAYLAKGEVTLGHRIGGLDLSVTGEGMVGVQAEVKGEVSTSHVKGKIGLGPVGLGVKIDWGDIQ